MKSKGPFHGFVGLALVLACAIEANAQDLSHKRAVIEETFGAWQVYCRTAPHGRSCALVQNVIAEDRQNLDLKLMIYRWHEDDTILLRAIVPLGVLLPKGLGLSIDNQNAGATPFVKCTKHGCVAEAVLKKEEIDRLKRGKTAVFVIYETVEVGIGVPVSLEGFADGYAYIE